MTGETNKNDLAIKSIDDPAITTALNELGRLINIMTTYGVHHPAVQKSADTAIDAFNTLFADRKRVIIGVFNGMLTVDETAVRSSGALLKSLERRLGNLQISGLKLSRGIDHDELMQLVELLSCKEAAHFEERMEQSNLQNIASENTRYQAVREGQTVANASDLAGMGGEGVLVLEDDLGGGGSETEATGGQDNSVHVDQIVAFLKGDVELDDDESISEELSEMASDPARLGKMIMESVAVRQSASELSGESLGDIVLGCLRRTFTGLRKQSTFQTKEGKEDLSKALLLLEENILDQMRNLTGDADPEMDRQIVQAIREMDEHLGFETAAMQYADNRAALEASSQELQAFIQSHGAEAAKDLLSDTDFPPADWQKIVVESRKSSGEGVPPVSTGLSSLVNVFDKLEHLMKSKESDGSLVKNLLGQATENLDDTLFHTREKLEVLSQQLHGDIETIGGQGLHMDQTELLRSLSEVAQELMQPLTAVNASLEMMLKGYVGEFSDDQQDLLGLASNSGEHLTFLMRELIDIVGCPVNKGVDERFHTTSDEVILKQTG